MFSSLDMLQVDVKYVSSSHDWCSSVMLRRLVILHVLVIIDQFQKRCPAITDTFDIGTSRLFEFWERTGPMTGNWYEDYWSRSDVPTFYERHGEGAKAPALLMDKEQPFNLRIEHLRRGLRPMNVREEVIDRVVPPAGSNERRQYDAELTVVRALTRTFHRMFQAGLTYGCLTTAEAFVFLKIDYTSTPLTLLYHLAEPTRDVAGNGGDLAYSAVCQTLDFTIMALDAASRENSQDKCAAAARNANVWLVDKSSDADTVDDTSKTAGRSVPASEYARSVRKTRDANDVPSASTLSPRFSRPQVQHEMCEIAGGNAGILSSIQKSSDTRYCTHKCLLGLVTGDVLDGNCPNVELHGEVNRRHAIDHTKFLWLLRQQFQRSLVDGVVRLGMKGSTGVIFKVTLLGYGYTFVGKGTVDERVENMEHEAAVYKRLRPIQGVYVPVYLGEIDLIELETRYFYEIAAELTFFTFMSWGGSSLVQKEPQSDNLKDLAEGVPDDAKVVRGVLESLRAINKHWVRHEDVARRNILWDARTQKVIVIDFEHAQLRDLPSYALEYSSNYSSSDPSTEKDDDKDTPLSSARDETRLPANMIWDGIHISPGDTWNFIN